MNTILVATDFSQSATNAVDYATGLAIALNAELCLFHVSKAPMIVGDIPLKVEEAEIRENSKALLEELRIRVNKKGFGKVPVKIDLRAGDVNQELQLACEDMNPLVVVMGNQGRSALERFFFGNHSIHAMRHLKCPLITVPPNAGFSTIRKIGLTYDFEQDIDPLSFETIRLFVKAFHAKLHIINIGKKNEFISGKVFGSGELGEMLNDLKPDYHFLTGEDSNEEILKFIQQNQMDLLVVIPGIHGILGNLNHKSHGKQFILHSHIPVLSIRQ